MAKDEEFMRELESKLNKRNSNENVSVKIPNVKNNEPEIKSEKDKGKSSSLYSKLKNLGNKASSWFKSDKGSSAPKEKPVASNKGDDHVPNENRVVLGKNNNNPPPKPLKIEELGWAYDTIVKGIMARVETFNGIVESINTYFNKNLEGASKLEGFTEINLNISNNPNEVYKYFNEFWKVLYSTHTDIAKEEAKVTALEGVQEALKEALENNAKDEWPPVDTNNKEDSLYSILRENFDKYLKMMDFLIDALNAIAKKAAMSSKKDIKKDLSKIAKEKWAKYKLLANDYNAFVGKHNQFIADNKDIVGENNIESTVKLLKDKDEGKIIEFNDNIQIIKAGAEGHGKDDIIINFFKNEPHKCKNPQKGKDPLDSIYSDFKLKKENALWKCITDFSGLLIGEYKDVLAKKMEISCRSIDAWHNQPLEVGVLERLLNEAFDEVELALKCLNNLQKSAENIVNWVKSGKEGKTEVKKSSSWSMVDRPKDPNKSFEELLQRYNNFVEKHNEYCISGKIGKFFDELPDEEKNDYDGNIWVVEATPLEVDYGLGVKDTSTRVDYGGGVIDKYRILEKECLKYFTGNTKEKRTKEIEEYMIPEKIAYVPEKFNSILDKLDETLGHFSDSESQNKSPEQKDVVKQEEPDEPINWNNNSAFNELNSADTDKANKNEISEEQKNETSEEKKIKAALKSKRSEMEDKFVKVFDRYNRKFVAGYNSFYNRNSNNGNNKGKVGEIVKSVFPGWEGNNPWNPDSAHSVLLATDFGTSDVDELKKSWKVFIIVLINYLPDNLHGRYEGSLGNILTQMQKLDEELTKEQDEIQKTEINIKKVDLMEDYNVIANKVLSYMQAVLARLNSKAEELDTEAEESDKEAEESDTKTSKKRGIKKFLRKITRSKKKHKPEQERARDLEEALLIGKDADGKFLKFNTTKVSTAFNKAAKLFIRNGNVVKEDIDINALIRQFSGIKGFKEALQSALVSPKLVGWSGTKDGEKVTEKNRAAMGVLLISMAYLPGGSESINNASDGLKQGGLKGTDMGFKEYGSVVRKYIKREALKGITGDELINGLKADSMAGMRLGYFINKDSIKQIMEKFAKLDRSQRKKAKAEVGTEKTSESEKAKLTTENVQQTSESEKVKPAIEITQQTSESGKPKAKKSKTQKIKSIFGRMNPFNRKKGQKTNSPKKPAKGSEPEDQDE